MERNPKTPTSTEHKVHLSLNLPEKVRKRMNEIQAMTNSKTLIEVVVKALAVYDTIVTSKAEGTRFYYVNRGGVETEFMPE